MDLTSPQVHMLPVKSADLALSQSPGNHEADHGSVTAGLRSVR